MINNIKLKAKIIENGYSVDGFAPAVGMCATTLMQASEVIAKKGKK